MEKLKVSGKSPGPITSVMKVNDAKHKALPICRGRKKEQKNRGCSKSGDIKDLVHKAFITNETCEVTNWDKVV